MNSTSKKIQGQYGHGIRKNLIFAGRCAIFLLLCLLLPAAAFGVEVIVDDQGSGFSMERSNRWNIESDSQAYNNYHHVSDHNDPQDVYFRPDLPDGYYYVYVRWVEAPDRDYQVRYRVYYNRGNSNSDWYIINQRDGGGEWQQLINPSRADGKFYFRGGSSEYVRMQMGNTGSNYTISADAALFRDTVLPTTTTTTTTTLPPSPSECDIIIDNDDLITESQGRNDNRGFYFDNDNSWEWTSRTDSQAYNGDHYESNRNDARVYWVPMLPRSGDWEVFVRYADDPGYDNNAEYGVERRGSRTNVTVNQRFNGGQWVSLGTFNFSAGNSQDNNVRLTQQNNTEEVSADAVRFVEAGCSVATTTTIPTSTTTTTLPGGDCTYIVDNADDTPLPFDTDSNWSLVDDNEAYAGNYLRSTGDNADAYFRPPLVYEGDYRVSIWYVSDSYMNDNNRLYIYYDGGSSQDDYAIDQETGGGEWVDQAVYHFNGNDPDHEYVRIRGTSGYFWDAASADAVKFERIGGCPGGVTTTTTTTTSTSTTSSTSTTTTSTTTTTLPPGTCGAEPIADMPLDAMMQPAPAILMFVLDDSGSMDWETMTSEDDGVFRGEYYVFNDPGDNQYSSSYILSGTSRDYWRARWSGYNYMYFNPKETYTPWPWVPGVTAITGADGVGANANPDTPRSHPAHSSPTFNLSTTYDTIDTDDYDTNQDVVIARSHFFDYVDSNGNGVLDNNEPVYLANIVSSTGTVDYYRVTESSSGRITGLSDKLLPADIPAGFPTDYTTVRQNFANWYSFYRRRELTATTAVANVIYGLEGVQVGIRSINGRIVQPVMQIKVGNTDETADLLNVLYSMELRANGTPLRQGLKYVGQYLDQDDNNNGGGLGNSPYASAEDGGACQQAFTVVMTDGYYNGSSPNVGNVDGNNGNPYDDNWSNTLADVAMYYYENDLADNLEGVVPMNETDRNSQQHMVTYGVSFGVFGSLDPNDYNISDAPNIPWPNPDSANENRIDDLWHAAVNGRGIFLSARNPMELVQNLRAVMQNIASREGSAASVSINGDELNEEVNDEIRMYQTIYRSDGWRGDLKSFRVSSVTGIPDTSDPVWSASREMTDLIGADGAYNNLRVIATYDEDGTYSSPSGVGMPFNWTSMSGTTSQWMLLDPNAATAENILNYLRGDSSNEEQYSGTLRNRFVGQDDSVLGDFIHSRPLYYEESNANVLFVGGNDGMLHAFNALTGVEMFAYIPGLVFENIYQLSDPFYEHEYFVDNTVTIRKFTNKSILVAGLGKGGRGYFALDVLNPQTITTEAILSSRVMWEYPAPGVTDPDMGYSFSESFILKSNDTTINQGTEFEGYVLIFGNGYSSPDGQALLYVLNPLDGTVIEKIYGGTSTSCNGMSTPAPVDRNNDGTVDYVYAGDLLGNLWKFDLSSSNHTLWESAYASSGVSMPLFTASADRSTASAASQAITTRPDVMYQCGLDKGYLVIFGTGKYLENGDVNDTTLESIYAVWDYGDDADDSEFLGRFDTGSTFNLSNQPANVTLLEQTAIYDNWVSDLDGDGKDEYFRVLSNNQIKRWTEDDDNPDQNANPGPGSRGSDGIDNDNDGEIDEADEQVAHAGWFFDLPISKERVITNLLIRDNKAIVISFTPTEGSCSGRGGFSIIHEMDACSGGRPGTWVSATDLVFDINGDNEITVADYDLDGNGYIDFENNDGINEFYVDMNGDGVADIKDFIVLDVNGDGRISTNEFSVLDTNGDGDIDVHDLVFIEEPVINITADNMINRDDYIIIDVYDDNSGEYVPLAVPVTGLRREGMLHPPPILRMDDVEKKYMSSSTGLIEIITEPAEKRGMNYWKKLK